MTSGRPHVPWSHSRDVIGHVSNRRSAGSNRPFPRYPQGRADVDGGWHRRRCGRCRRPRPTLRRMPASSGLRKALPLLVAIAFAATACQWISGPPAIDCGPLSQAECVKWAKIAQRTGEASGKAPPLGPPAFAITGRNGRGARLSSGDDADRAGDPALQLSGKLGRPAPPSFVFGAYGWMRCGIERCVWVRAPSGGEPGKQS